jgi:regulator of sirC expression with transglutaminase-like and TPR domain
VEPTAEFSDLVRGPDEAVPLARAAMLIAAHASPGLDVDRELDVFDELATGCAPGDLDEWHDHLFRELAFTGNTLDYHDPRNSLLNEVVHRRLGIPITLAVVGIEVGHRLGVHLTGIGMPGHFLLHHEGLPPVFIDPFDGDYLDEAGCERRFRAVHGPEPPFLATYLAPVGSRAILGRMLANLRGAYLRLHDYAAAEWVVRLRLALPDTGPEGRGDLAHVLVRRGRFREAAAELEAQAEADPEQAGALLGAARRLRGRLN